MSFELVKLAHVIGACVLLGTGSGIAFFMVMAHRSRDPALIAHVAGIVVIADALFTAAAVVLQPVTGFFLARMAGWSMLEGWILAAIGLYLFVGAFWIPVVFLQVWLRDTARLARDTGTPLPDRYWRIYRLWFVCGFPGFGGVIAILWLMIARPSF